MTWTTVEDGWWSFTDQRTPWIIRTSPDRPEKGIFLGRRHSHSDSGPLVQLLPSASAGHGVGHSVQATASRCFPPLLEAYVRSGTLITVLPQDDEHNFGVSITHQVLISDENKLVLETVVAIQTSFLDSHPTIDLVANNIDGEVHGLLATAGRNHPVTLQHVREQAQHPPAGSRFVRSAHVGSAYLLLPPSDRAVASVQPTATDAVCYRLLSEFMEKGVIRKARFWTCVWATTPELAQLQQAYDELVQQPLPLAP